MLGWWSSSPTRLTVIRPNCQIILVSFIKNINLFSNSNCWLVGVNNYTKILWPKTSVFLAGMLYTQNLYPV